MRINKYLSAKGVCSRREADRLLEAGRITVDGAVAECGQQVDDNNIICIDGSKISNDKPEDILIAFNKPVGIVCTTTNKQGNNNIVDYIGYSERIYPIGRLDKESDGLILLTNNGEITDRILRSVNGHEKEYIVKVNKNITKEKQEKKTAGEKKKEKKDKSKEAENCIYSGWTPAERNLFYRKISARFFQKKSKTDIWYCWCTYAYPRI